jgi:hypothetical protein
VGNPNEERAHSVEDEKGDVVEEKTDILCNCKYMNT